MFLVWRILDVWHCSSRRLLASCLLFFVVVAVVVVVVSNWVRLLTQVDSPASFKFHRL